jgi:alanine dehydrogenase
VARTSAFALNNATLPYVLAIADRGWRRALSEDPYLRQGLNVCHGRVTHPAVARDLGLPFCAAERLLSG